MAKKNLPNIPIYIGDWERDCNILSLESEMAWMKIIFKLHLSGKQSVYKTSTKGLQILWKSNQEKVIEILDELRFNEICEITEISGGYEFLCRRFKKENDISKIRSEAVSERYKAVDKPKKQKLKTTKPLQKEYKTLQNTENDIENEIDIEVKNDIKDVIVFNNEKEIDFEEIVNIFNSVCIDIPKVTKLIDSRKEAIKKILSLNTNEELGLVFKKVSESDYLNGKVVSWKADFDWILKPDNFIKILEDKYKNNSKTAKQPKQYIPSDSLKENIARRLYPEKFT
jgi:hypothetical protein